MATLFHRKCILPRRLGMSSNKKKKKERKERRKKKKMQKRKKEKRKKKRRKEIPFWLDRCSLPLYEKKIFTNEIERCREISPSASVFYRSIDGTTERPMADFETNEI